MMAKNRNRKNKNNLNNNNNNYSHESQRKLSSEKTQNSDDSKNMPGTSQNNGSSCYNIKKSKNTNNILQKLQNSIETNDEDGESSDAVTSDGDFVEKINFPTTQQPQLQLNKQQQRSNCDQQQLLENEKIPKQLMQNNNLMCDEKNNFKEQKTTEELYAECQEPPKQKIKLLNGENLITTKLEQEEVNGDYCQQENVSRKKAHSHSKSSAATIALGLIKNNINVSERHAKRWGINSKTVVDESLPRLNRPPAGIFVKTLPSSSSSQTSCENNDDDVNIIKKTDKFFNQNNNKIMGQNHSKTKDVPPPSQPPFRTSTVDDSNLTNRQRKSRSQSPPTSSSSSNFNSTAKSFEKPSKEPIVTEPPISPQNSFDRTLPDDRKSGKFELPKISIADYSKKPSRKTSEPEVFYEFDEIHTNFNDSSNQPQINSFRKDFNRSSPVNVGLEDIEEEDENEDESNCKKKLGKSNEEYFNYSSNTPDSGFYSANNSSSESCKVLIINSCDLLNDDQDNNFHCDGAPRKLTEKVIVSDPYFIQDTSYSNVIQNHSSYEGSSNDHNILIDITSLPDVVVESTNSKLNKIDGHHSNKVNNVNKSKSVHFIPMHVEATNDTIIAGHHQNETVIEEIFEPEISFSLKNKKNIKSTNTKENLKQSSSNDYENENLLATKLKEENELRKNDGIHETSKTEQKKDSLNQEAVQFQLVELENARKATNIAQQKANELQLKVEKLENKLSTKSWNIERLEGELKAAFIEDECIRKRLKNLEDQKEGIKQKFAEDEEEYIKNYETLESQYKELQEKYEKLRKLANNLQTQLAVTQTDAESIRLEKDKLIEAKDEQIKQIQEILSKTERKQKDLEQKWQKEFELLRNQNQNREEQLFSDCEWQLREMRKNCKVKIEKSEFDKHEALEKVTAIESTIKQQMEDLKKIKTLRAEVNSLRGLTHEQCRIIDIMSAQMEELRFELEAANEELEEQIEEIRKIKSLSQSNLDYKDREMIQKISDARSEIAEMWEEKLLTEMTRLTNELETVHTEERLDDMNKITNENLEELKALTNRYTANEEEFKKEIENLKEQLRKRTDQYHELRDKADTAIWETRMTLDRADRDYQIEMTREEEKKERIMEQLRKDFDIEKEELEARFQLRLAEAKKEFEKQLAQTTVEIAEKHKLQLEKQWEQLVADKEEALSAMESRHRIRIADQEDKIHTLEVQHQRDMKDLKNAFDLDKQSLETRDMHNYQEIEQLHYKCRCLTNLFEEMRLRYERRDPRPEDLREIAELRSRCESQERDLDALTQRLREMQIQEETVEHKNVDLSKSTTVKKGKQIRKPPPKPIPICCDVIYEEEEREVSPDDNKTSVETTIIEENSSDSEEEEEDESSSSTNNQITADSPEIEN